MHALSLAR